jgi:phosphatidate cytidylyltransferase
VFELWSQPLFMGIVFVTLASIAGGCTIYYFLYRNRPEFKSSLASILSWLFIAPVIFLMLGMTWPAPLILVTIISIYGAKIFFQMTGMFHRSNFVYVCYAALIFSGYCIYADQQELFNLMPPIFFLGACLIPMIRNSYKRMVQYIALSMMNFLLLWCFLHLGRIMALEHGIYIAIYIIMLTEIFENVYLRVSRHFKKIKIVSELTPKRSLEGYVVGAVATLTAAYLLRHILPFPEHWWMLGCACFIFGSTGNTILVVIRRDLGIKVYGSFVIGRGDFFTRIERLVFVAPACYYVIRYITEGHL